MKYRFIAVEGNIGSGKTTLATQLAAHYKANLILEQFSENVFLPKFYQDKERYALPLELSFLSDRYHQLHDALQTAGQAKERTVADYTIFKTQLFARTNLNDDEFALFERLTGIMKTNLPEPDLLIYLDAPVEKLQLQIKKRGRSYEQNISDDYLQSIDAAYAAYLAQGNLNILRVDTSGTDFNKEEHFVQLIRILESENDFPAAAFVAC